MTSFLCSFLEGHLNMGILFLRPFDPLFKEQCLSRAIMHLVVYHKTGPPINLFVSYAQFASMPFSVFHCCSSCGT